MNNEADETSNIPAFPVEAYADGFADLGLALMVPSFCPNNLERFKAGLRRMRDVFGDDTADVLDHARDRLTHGEVVGMVFALERQPRPTSCGLVSAACP